MYIFETFLKEYATREQYPTQEDIVLYLGKDYPEEDEEHKTFHDKYGLFSIDKKSIVKKVLLSTTPTPKVRDYFLKNGYDLLISHHDNLYMDKKVPQIVFHSTMDQAKKGHNMYFANKLGLTNIKQMKTGPITGNLYKPLTLEEFTGLIKKRGFKINGMVYSQPNEDRKIQKVFFCSGLGGILLNKNPYEDVSNLDVDAFVTGELYMHPEDSMYKFPYIIELGHTSSEKPLFKQIKHKLLNRWKNMQVDLADDEIDSSGKDWLG